MNLRSHLLRQMAFSHATFGPGKRMTGVLDHIEEEIEEVRESGGSPAEWADIVQLALDGLTRSLIYTDPKDPARRGNPYHAAANTCRMLEDTLTKCEARDWPDWRTADPDKRINHIREVASPVPGAARTLLAVPADLEKAARFVAEKPLRAETGEWGPSPSLSFDILHEALRHIAEAD